MKYIYFYLVSFKIKDKVINGIFLGLEGICTKQGREQNFKLVLILKGMRGIAG